jgi:hypothetical protein
MTLLFEPVLVKKTHEIFVFLFFKIEQLEQPFVFSPCFQQAPFYDLFYFAAIELPVQEGSFDNFPETPAGFDFIPYPIYFIIYIMVIFLSATLDLIN